MANVAIEAEAKAAVADLSDADFIEWISDRLLAFTERDAPPPFYIARLRLIAAVLRAHDNERAAGVMTFKTDDLPRLRPDVDVDAGRHR